MQSGTKCSLCQLNKKLPPKRSRPPQPATFSSTVQSLYNYSNHTSTLQLQTLHTRGLFMEVGCMKSHVDALLHLREGAMVSSFSCNLWQMLKFRAHHSFN